MRKDNKGITLIALVVTIIILLVLAGISIATLSGENGLINRAVTAKENTESAQEIEILQQAAVQAMGKSKSGDVEKQYLDAALANNSAIESTQDSAGGVKVTFKSGREYIVSADGDVKEKATYSNEIKELLKVKNNVSPYVNYIDANGNTITCRVLYDASSSYGIEIISDDIIKNGEEMEIVILGKNDSNPFVTPSAFDTTGITYPQNISDSQKKSAASYNRAITTLNEKAHM